MFLGCYDCEVTCIYSIIIDQLHTELPQQNHKHIVGVEKVMNVGSTELEIIDGHTTNRQT